MSELTDAVQHQLLSLEIWLLSLPLGQSLAGKHFQLVTEWILFSLFAGGLCPAVGARTAGHQGSRHPHPLGTEQCCSLPGRSNSRCDLPTASGDSPRVEPTHPPEACECWEGGMGWEGSRGCSASASLSSAPLSQVSRGKKSCFNASSHCTTVQPGLFSCLSCLLW